MAKLLRAAIMGPPGSGKGTISKRIAQTFGLQYLSSGHYLRESIAANTGKINLLMNSNPDTKAVVLKNQPAERCIDKLDTVYATSVKCFNIFFFLITNNSHEI